LRETESYRREEGKKGIKGGEGKNEKESVKMDVTKKKRKN
jgi:hypothetical protein